MNKNLCLNDSEKDWLLKVRSGLNNEPNQNNSNTPEPILLPPNDEIWYTTVDGKVISSPEMEVGYNLFSSDSGFLSNTYSDGKGIIKFDGPINSVQIMVNGAFKSYYKTLLSVVFPPLEDLFAPFPNGPDYLSSITLGDTEFITNNEVSAFCNYCSNLTSIRVIGNTNYDSRDNCNAIIETSTNKLIVACKTTVIPKSVTTLDYLSFLNCSGLTSLTIPSGITNIGWFAFQGCTDLKYIICEPVIPPSILPHEDYSFDDYGEITISIPKNCNIYVPEESINEYKASAVWAPFESQIFPRVA